MIDVGGNDHAAAGHFVAHKLGRQLLAVGNVTHLFGDDTLARIVHLREVAVRVFLLTPGKPLGARAGDAVAVAVIAVRSMGRSHRVHTFLISKLYLSPPFLRRRPTWITVRCIRGWRFSAQSATSSAWRGSRQGFNEKNYSDSVLRRSKRRSAVGSSTAGGWVCETGVC